MEWSNEKVILFLEILQTEPCLWDPRLKSYKNRSSQNDAWRKVMAKLPFNATLEELKKKKESLMGYYRSHLNKFKKSLKSGAGKNDVYKTNWFAYEIMDSFLRGVYETNSLLNTEIDDYSEAQERNEGQDDGNSSHLALELEEATQNKKENRTRPRENRTRPKENQDCGRKRQVRDDLPQEIKAARRQMDEAFEFIKDKKDDEYEMFGRLIASKIKKIRNPNTRDMLMNDIHNLVFRTCMADRLEPVAQVDLPYRSAVTQFSTSQSPHHQVFSPSPNPDSYQSPPGPSTSRSPHRQVFSPSRNAAAYQSPPGTSTYQSPHRQVFSPSPNPAEYQSLPGPSTSQSPHHQVFSQSPNPAAYQSPPGPSTSQSPHHQEYSPSPNPPTYQSPPDPSTSQSPHHQEYSPSPNPPTYQSPPGFSTSQSPHHQEYSTSPNPPTYQSPPGPSTSQSPHHQEYSPSPNPPTYQSPPGFSTSQSPHHQEYSPSPNPPTYQSPLRPSTSQSSHHQVFNSSLHPSSYQAPNRTASQSLRHEINCSLPLYQFSVQSSQENFLELPPPSRASQIVITDSGEIKIIKD